MTGSGSHSQPHPRRHVVFVNRFFWPDHSATAQILGDLAFDLAARGWQVEVIASRLRYDDTGGTRVRLASREQVRGVTIRRVATPAFGRARLAGRAIDYLGFYLTAWFAALATLRRGTVLVVKTDPPMLGIPMILAARLRGARQVNWMQDIYPELAAELRVPLAGGPAGRLLGAIRDAAWRASSATVAIGERMRDRMLAARVPADRISVIHNWTDDAAILPLPAGDNPLRTAWGFAEDELVIGYSGNLGRSHELDTMLGAAGLLRGRRVRFLFVGGGHLRTTLGAETRARDLADAIVTQPYQTIAALPLSMTVADIQWLSLQPALEGLIVPSKFYSAAASGRPIVFIGDPDGEIARLIAAAGCGWSFAPGEAAPLAALLARVDRGEIARRGANARALVTGRLSRRSALNRWERLLTSVASRGSQSHP